MPLALLGVHWLLERRWWGWPLLGITIALALLGGHPQLFGYLFAVPGVYALTRIAAAMRLSRLHGLRLALSLGTAFATLAVRLAFCAGSPPSRCLRNLPAAAEILLVESQWRLGLSSLACLS